MWGRVGEVDGCDAIDHQFWTKHFFASLLTPSPCALAADSGAGVDRFDKTCVTLVRGDRAFLLLRKFPTDWVTVCVCVCEHVCMCMCVRCKRE